MKMRVTRQRKEFGAENFSFIERDAGEQPQNIPPSKNNFNYVTKRKVLELGLQAANKMKVNIHKFELITCRASNHKPTSIGWSML